MRGSPVQGNDKPRDIDLYVVKKRWDVKASADCADFADEKEVGADCYLVRTKRLYSREGAPKLKSSPTSLPVAFK